MSETKIQQVNDLYRIAGGDLSKLKEQIDHIIVIKKKSSEKLSKDVMLVQAGDALKAVNNLEEINTKLTSAVSNINVISQEIRPLLEKQFGVKLEPTAGLQAKDSR